MADVHHDLDDPGHGHTTAAWTGTGIILLGTLLACLGMIFSLTWMWILGVIGVLGGIGAWIGLNRAGYGPETAKRH